ncbi:MAG TPA: sulfatase, partial [Prolixibacteraceae bacterium]|nr:sulfatase [Prolixibacteraceae bacterium]
MKKEWVFKLGVGVALSVFAYGRSEAKTNFVFFIADDCTWSDLGCYGGVNVKTPNIDRLAGEGIRFTRCFQAAPMCSPTRHNLLTGMYPTKTGAYPNHTFVKPGTQSVVQYLKPQGYRVALAGKRHIAPQEVFDFEYLGGGKNLNFDRVDDFLSDVKSTAEPFCLFLCSHEPHTPWNKGNPARFDPEAVVLSPFWVDTRETREAYCRYQAEIEYLDNEVGRAIDLLGKHGVADETVFVFTSEQGNSFPFAKWTCYNSGLHTALIVRWPGKTRPGTVSDCLTDYSDVLPTFLDIAGVPIPKQLDGFSLKEVLTGGKATRKKYSFALQTTRGIISGSEYFGIRSVTDGRYRLIVNLTP